MNVLRPFRLRFVPGQLISNYHAQISDDHAQIAELHQPLSHELLLLSNLPAVDQGNYMIQELAALRRTIETWFEGADRQFEGINHQLAETNLQLGRINNTLNVKQV